ncbi:MAG TPA: hypothetical protein VEI54_03860 [Candidatus Limnocylindrales bacterium]|nr:hypothetical protein [Candidatus Limnocylindrales bacterium]
MPSPSTEKNKARQDELDWIAASRTARLGAKLTRAPEDSLIGLAFSGGGIRSATFNLGVIQGLAKSKLLHKMDFVSSVSGGGYISSWLLGWMQHQGLGAREVERQLRSEQVDFKKLSEPPEIRFLRNFSNYLTPRKGLFSPDFWTFLAIYFRNTSLNLVILLSALLAVIFAPRVVVWIFHIFERLENFFRNLLKTSFDPWYLSSQYIALYCGFVLGAVAVVYIGLNMAWLEPGQDGLDEKTYEEFSSPPRVRERIALPLVFAAACLSYAFLWFFEDFYVSPEFWWEAALLGMMMYTLQWALAGGVREFIRLRYARKGKPAPQGGPNLWKILLCAAFTGLLSGFLFLPFGHLLHRGGIPELGQQHSLWFVLTFGPPALIGIMLITGIVHIGLLGRSMSDDHREWWARLGAQLFLYAVGWLLLFSVAIYFPIWLRGFLGGKNWTHHPLTFSSVFVWAASTIYGVLFGKSAKTSHWTPNAAWTKKILHYLAVIAPYIFVGGMLLGLSLLAAAIFNSAVGEGFVLGWTLDPGDYSWWLVVVCGACVAATWLLSWRVDVNEFSVHLLYRNRLVRCFLGASVKDRQFQPWTGLSWNDNLALSDITSVVKTPSGDDGRPFPILNTTLNVVHGRELALQMRKARSFTFTPTYSGFTRPLTGGSEWEMNYQLTRDAGPKPPDRSGGWVKAFTKQAQAKSDGAPTIRGVSLGTAMAISGAAASPNMGSYSDPAIGFLLTVFDVRLGWWIGNPRYPEAWKQGRPNSGFAWLVRELLGLTTDEQDFIYLSDGGHFENLGLYELVRRRCKVIIASDVSQDPHYGGAELRNAMERCRVDFGVEIYIDLGNFKPQGDPPRSGCHYAIGNILYPPISKEESAHERNGTLIVLKPAIVTGDPFDVRGYPQTNPQFPHDTTLNQWFDEAHFENYRALGECTAVAASRDIAAVVDDVLR